MHYAGLADAPLLQHSSTIKPAQKHIKCRYFKIMGHKYSACRFLKRHDYIRKHRNRGANNRYNDRGKVLGNLQGNSRPANKNQYQTTKHNNWNNNNNQANQQHFLSFLPKRTSLKCKMFANQYENRI